MVVELTNEGQRPVAIIAIGQVVSKFRRNDARAPFRLFLKPFLIRREKLIRREDIPYSELAVIKDQGNETEEIVVLEAANEHQECQDSDVGGVQSARERAHLMGIRSGYLRSRRSFGRRLQRATCAKEGVRCRTIMYWE